MRRRTAPLLCELHAHTTWSDGDLSVRQPNWKTLLPCEPHAAAVVEYLRSSRPTSLARVEAASVEPRAA